MIIITFANHLLAEKSSKFRNRFFKYILVELYNVPTTVCVIMFWRGGLYSIWIILIQTYVSGVLATEMTFFRTSKRQLLNKNAYQHCVAPLEFACT